MAVIHFATILCEPNTGNRHRKPYFCEIRPCSNDIMYARFEVLALFCSFLLAFLTGFYTLTSMGKCTSRLINCFPRRRKADLSNKLKPYFFHSNALQCTSYSIATLG